LFAQMPAGPGFVSIRASVAPCVKIRRRTADT